MSAVCSVVLSAPQVFAFKLQSPSDGATLKSGQAVTVTVDLGADSGIVKVRYYWYGNLPKPWYNRTTPTRRSCRNKTN